MAPLGTRTSAPDGASQSKGAASVPERQRRWTLPTGWPVAVALVGYPVWWALGLTTLVFPVLALFLGAYLVRTRSFRAPPGFWLWGLFLLWVLASAVALDLTATGTLSPSGTGRYLAYASRFANYAAVTVLLLFVGNTDEATLPKRRLISWLAWLFGICIVMGLIAVIFPGLSFRNPLAGLLPSTLVEAGGAVREFAQYQPVLGDPSPRPSAPFAFTNAWGNNVSLLLVWFVVAAWVAARHRNRWFAVVAVAAATVPIVFSLNRAMWIGLGLSLIYVAVRLAVVGRFAAIMAIVVALGLGSAVFVATPLSTMVTARVDAGHSNDVRTTLATDAVRLATQSPIVGFGSTRATAGSGSSIAVGQSADCPRCGNRVIGSTGQLWLILVAQGFVGALLYLSYLVRTVVAFRGDHSPIGIAGTLVVLLTLFYSLFYTALAMPLAIAFISIGLLWRNKVERAAAGLGPHVT